MTVDEDFKEFCDAESKTPVYGWTPPPTVIRRETIINSNSVRRFHKYPIGDDSYIVLKHNRIKFKGCDGHIMYVISPTLDEVEMLERCKFVSDNIGNSYIEFQYVSEDDRLCQRSDSN